MSRTSQVIFHYFRTISHNSSRNLFPDHHTIEDIKTEIRSIKKSKRSEVQESSESKRESHDESSEEA